MNNRTHSNHKITITTALVGSIFALTLVVGSICALLLAQWISDEFRREEEQRFNLTASGIASLISQSMEERYDEVRQVRDLLDNEMRFAPVAHKRQVIERVQTEREHFSWLGIVAATGEIEIGTSGLLEGLSVAGRNWFEGAREKSYFFGNIHPAKLLEPHIKNADGAPLYLLDIALPLHKPTGEFDGVVGSHFNWKMIEDLARNSFKSTNKEGELSIAVVDSEGSILFDTQNTTGNVNEILSLSNTRQMIEAQWPGETLSSFIVAVPVPSNRTFNGLGWQIVVRTPTAKIDQSIHQMQWKIATVSLFTALLFSVLGILTVKQVTRPIRKLISELNQFGENESLPMLDKPYLIKEMHELHRAFFDMAIRVATHKEMLRETQSEIVRTLGRASEFRDNETGNHILRMSYCCEHLALLAGWTAGDAEQLRLASQMHDVGKIGIPDQILLKPGRFEPEERAIMEQHCSMGARILSGIDTPLTVLARSIALNHHEKWNGTGYPNQLSGEAIPQAGRIAALCDVFDALLSSRPYKQGWPLEKVVSLITEESGCHFDPQLANLFLANLDDFVAIRARFLD